MSADWFRNTTWDSAIERAFDEKILSSGEDSLALIFDFGTNDTIDEVSLSIVWGSGRVVAELFPDRMPLSEAAMAQVVEAFPRFSAALVSEGLEATHDA